MRNSKEKVLENAKVDIKLKKPSSAKFIIKLKKDVKPNPFGNIA